MLRFGAGIAFFGIEGNGGKSGLLVQEEGDSRGGGD